MEDVRRLVARIGASSAAHPVDAPATTAHGVGDVRPAVTAPPLVPDAGTHTSPPLATTAGFCGDGGLATTARVAAVAPAPPGTQAVQAGVVTTVRAVPGAVTRPGRAGPLLPRPARSQPVASEGHPMRTLRRARVPWTALSRERLAAVWARVQIEHADAGELLLVGVFGPLPIDIVSAVALDPDGRLAVTVGRRRPGGRRGDVVLARVAATGRLVRTDVAHPGAGWIGRGLR